MKMLKMGKKKVIAGVVTVGLLTGGGAVFGATDAGTNIKNWFEGVFLGEKAGVEAQYNKYWDGEITELDKLVATKKSEGKTKIDVKARGEITAKGKKIALQASEHVDAIKIESKKLEKYMNDEFTKLKKKADEDINNAGTVWFQGAHADLEKVTNELGDAARADVETKLDKITDQALTDIQDAIDSTKKELLELLAKKSDATAVEIKELIDKSIFGITYQINAGANYMIQEQEGLIAALAASLETDAMKKMKDLVDGI